MHRHVVIHLYTFYITVWKLSSYSLESYWKKWIRKLKNIKESKACEKGVFAGEASLQCLGEGVHIASVNSTVVNPRGRLQEGDGEFLFFALAHSAYICLRDRKLISSYLSFFFPFLFCCCLCFLAAAALLVPWGWGKKALGGPGAIT